jgi:hypothetical protein
VAFDENSAEHRRWFAEFVKYNTWGRCPVRFMAESLDQDLVTYIEHKMLSYYVKQEFESGRRKVKTTSTAKPKSKGTRGIIRGQYAVQTPKGQFHGTVPKTPKTRTKESV